MAATEFVSRKSRESAAANPWLGPESIERLGLYLLILPCLAVVALIVIVPVLRRPKALL